MNNLDERLLKLFIKEDRYLSIKEISNILGCSNRTVYNSINRIKDYLDENRIAYELVKDHSRGVRLKLLSTDFSFDYIQIEIAALILKEKNVLIKDLMQDYYMSYHKLTEILSSIEDDMAYYDTSLDIRQNNGINISGSEADINLFKRDLVVKAADKDKYIKDLYKENLIIQANRLANLMIANIGLNPIIKQELSIYILYILENPSVKYKEMDDHKASLNFILAQAAAEICVDFNKSLKENNLEAYFNWVFKVLNIVSYLTYKPIANKFSKKLIAKLRSHFISIGDEILNVSDETLTSLERHLELTILKTRYDGIIKNPLHTSIKKNYPYYYNEVVFVLDNFNKSHNLKIPLVEASYIVIYLITIEQTFSEKLKAVIVCNYGIGISQYIYAVLLDNINWVDFKEPITFEEFDIEKYKDYVIFSTMDLDGVDYIKIPLDLNEIDIERIEREITSREFVSLFYDNLVYIDIDLIDKQEIIKFMGENLEELDLVERGYQQTIIDREEIATTEIGDCLVLLHGDPKLIRQSSISFMKLKNKILWQEEKVRIIFLISVKSSEYEKYNIKEFFKSLHRFKKDKSFLYVRDINDLKSIFYQ